MPSNIDELVSSIEVELERAQKRYDKARTESKMILEDARKEARAALTPEETERFETLREAGEKAKEEIASVKDKLARATTIQAEEREADKLAKETRQTTAPKPKYDQVARVGNEERQYHPGNDPAGQHFLRDVALAQVYREPSANDRLNRHMQEERVERGMYAERAGDIATTGMGGLVVPQYLVDMTAMATANLRPFADACNPHVLPPEGMSVIIPTTSATGAALQTENATVQDTALTETDLTLTVKTAAGQQSVSRQAVERGMGIGDIVVQDLMRRYATSLDNELINGASTGLKAKGTVVTYTSGAPTGPEHYGQILGTLSQVEVALKGVAVPNLVVMHGRRWYWLQSQMVSVWPMVGGTFTANAAGVDNNSIYGTAIRGQLPNGVAVCVDDNVVTNLGVATNQDQIYVTARAECHLWEAPGQPTFIRAEQPLANQLSILFVVYGYFAYTFARYANSVQALDGTGLVRPSGF
jgi:HK97 family phage major capsid protein